MATIDEFKSELRLSDDEVRELVAAGVIAAPTTPDFDIEIGAARRACIDYSEREVRRLRAKLPPQPVGERVASIVQGAFASLDPRQPG